MDISGRRRERRGEREEFSGAGAGAGKGSDCNGHQLPPWGSADVLTLDCGMGHKPVKTLSLNCTIKMGEFHGMSIIPR